MGLVDVFLGRPEFAGVAETAVVTNLEAGMRSLQQLTNAPAIAIFLH